MASSFQHRQFPRPEKGSPLRPAAVNPDGSADSYRDVIAWGSNAAGNSTSVADGGTGTFTFTISEAGHASNLVLQGNAAVALVAGDGLAGASVTSIKHGLSEMVTGSIPATLFRAESVQNPKLGHWFKTSDVVTCQVVNQSGATVEYAAGITTM